MPTATTHAIQVSAMRVATPSRSSFLLAVRAKDSNRDRPERFSAGSFVKPSYVSYGTSAVAHVHGLGERLELATSTSAAQFQSQIEEESRPQHSCRAPMSRK